MANYVVGIYEEVSSRYCRAFVPHAEEACIIAEWQHCILNSSQPINARLQAHVLALPLCTDEIAHVAGLMIIQYCVCEYASGWARNLVFTENKYGVPQRRGLFSCKCTVPPASSSNAYVVGQSSWLYMHRFIGLIGTMTSQGAREFPGGPEGVWHGVCFTLSLHCIASWGPTHWD